MAKAENVEPVGCESTIVGPANRPARSVAGVHARGCRGKWLRRAALALVILGAIGAGLFAFRARILTAFAEAWVINDSPGHVDAIVVLGGGVENRPAAAAAMYREGMAPRVLYMDVRLAESAKLGIALPERELTRRMLLSNGVPETGMEAIGNGVTSTYDESRAVEAWARKSGAKTVIIPTDWFHTRRARWIFHKELKAEGVTIYMRGIHPVDRYELNDWWRHEPGLIAFQNEIVKSLYYWYEY